MEQNQSGKFYDIHMHAFNLSHPSLSSFLKRFLLEYGIKIIFSIVVVLVSLYVLFIFKITTVIFGFVLIITLVLITLHAMSPSAFSNFFFNFIVKIAKRPLNLLALIENDLGNYFLLAEKVLKTKKRARMINEKGLLVVNGREFSKMVITPLMMDFGLPERISKKLPYGAKPIHKPIADQVLDVINGIRTYLHKSELKIFEIYPFLGLNTHNYTPDELRELLDKYFKGYKRTEQAFHDKLGTFKGDIEKLSVNFFIGIKLYPPLGFDPWPVDDYQKSKVKLLYHYCQLNQIPITVHCSDGGFVVDSIFASQDRTSPTKWAQVLNKFGHLRLNLAHMGHQGWVSRLRYRKEKLWTDHVFELIAEYEHVYTDFSCRGFTDVFYRSLKKLINNKSDDLSGILKDKKYTLTDKIIFGSDFMINLLSTDSYNDYLKVFSETVHFTDEEKEKFYKINPEKFLFS